MEWQSIQIVGASACVIFILLQKIQKMVKSTRYLLVPAHPGCPGQSPQSREMVVYVCVCVCVCDSYKLGMYVVA